MRIPVYSTHLFAVTSCLVLHALSGAYGATRQNHTWPSRTYPGHLGYPTTPTWHYFARLLDGELITPLEPGYLNASKILNLRFMRLPGMIVKAKTVTDVQRTVLFARKYNLHLTVRSSGHDFIGRCTHDGSLNLNLELMKDIKIDLKSNRSKAGEIKVQSGASWIEVYTEVDKVRGPDETGQKEIGRVVVGPSAHTVAVGGFTLGGGHSPIGRKFGLAVDRLREATIVTADGNVHIVSSSGTVTTDLDGTVTTTTDTSLFTAIRGGGGSTWGVVTDFTFDLNYASERTRSVSLYIAAIDRSGHSINKETVDFALSQLTKLSPDWGGYIIATRPPEMGNQSLGCVILFLNHQGSNSSTSNKEIEPLLTHPNMTHVEEKYHPTFLDYQITTLQMSYHSSYIFNSFIQPPTAINASRRTDFVNLMYEMLKENVECVGTLIGGGTMLIPIKSPMPTNPWMRLGILSMTCGINALSSNNYTSIGNALDYAEKLDPFGMGSYFNEPAEDMPDWKTRFWGSLSTYERLLKTKKSVDPTNFFWCHNCVGSDLGLNYASPEAIGLPGEPSENYFNSSRQFDEINAPRGIK